MSHDPLCPFAKWPEEDCYQRDARVSICALIAQVRADEREKAAQRVIALCAHTKYEGCRPCSHDEAAAAVRGES